MSNFIQNLKEKPESHRKRLALIISLSFTGLAFLIFLILFLGKFNEYSEMKSKQPKKESTFSEISKSYYEYKKSFDESDLAKQMEGSSFSQDSKVDSVTQPIDTNSTTNATGTATTTITE